MVSDSFEKYSNKSVSRRDKKDTNYQTTVCRYLDYYRTKLAT